MEKKAHQEKKKTETERVETMKIYISGAITGTDDYMERFNTAAEFIRAKGHEPVNPCDLNKILNPATTTYSDYMAVDLALLSVCDAIYMLKGWENSRGAKAENLTAQANDEIKILYEGINNDF